MSAANRDPRRMDPRNRRTKGFTKVRFKQESRRGARSLVTIILATIVALLLAGWIFTQLSTTLFRGTQQVRFTVDQAYGVAEKISDIRYKGIRAGRITKIDRKGEDLVLTAELDKDYGPLYRNARAQLRPATPLQDLYLDVIDPGTPGAGKLGDGTLPRTQTDTSVNVDDVLAVFQADERARLRELLDNLGNGLEDRGAALQAAVVQLTPLLHNATEIADALADRSAQTKRLVHNASILTEELGARDVQLRTLVREGAATFGTLQAGSADLDATLRELPGTLESVNTSFAALRGIVDRVDLAVDNLKPVADRLPSTLSSVSRLDGALGPAVSSLRAPVRELVPLSRRLVPVTSDLSAAAKALRPSVPALDKTTATLAECERGITGFFQWNASLTKFGDIRGPVPRGNLAIGVPDSGLSDTTRTPGKNCMDANTIGGRPGAAADEE